MQIATTMSAPTANLGPAPTPKELPALVDYAASLVERAHGLVQTPDPFKLKGARDHLDALPGVLDRAVAIGGIDRGVWWALQGTRLLARTARTKTVDLLARAEDPYPDRRPYIDALKAQMDLVLARVRNAQELVRKPWPN